MTNTPELEIGQIVHYTADAGDYKIEGTVTHAAIVLGSSHVEGRYYLDIHRGVYPVQKMDGSYDNVVEAYRLDQNEDGVPYSEEPRVGHWSLTLADRLHIRSFEVPVLPSPRPSPGRIVTYTSRNGDGITSPAMVLRTQETTNLEVIKRWGPDPEGTLSGKGRPAGLVPDLVDPYTVDLLVHGLGGDYREYAVPFSALDGDPRTWMYPNRV